MGFITNTVNKWAIKSQQKQIISFINSLKAMNGDEIGMVIAIATHIRHELRAQGDNVMDPVVCASLNPNIIFILSRTVIDLQKSHQYSDAAGFMVWVHTLRAANTPEIRRYGRDMWNELSRGFDYVLETAHQIHMMAGKAIMYEGYYEYPVGLTPEVL